MRPLITQILLIFTFPIAHQSEKSAYLREKLDYTKNNSIIFRQLHKTMKFLWPEILLAEKEAQIQKLKEQISELKAQIKEFTQYESAEKISIVEDKLATVIDLFRQFQELTLPDERKLFRSQTQSPWYKMLSRYFLHGEKEIPINTARNYFPANENTRLIKGSEVADEDRIFKIIPTQKQV